MTPVEAAHRADEGTIWLCERTSWRDPRDFLRDCAVCSCPFWVHPRNVTRTRYCSDSCRYRAHHLRRRRTTRRAGFARRAA